MSHRTFYAATQTAPKAMRPKKISAQTPPHTMQRECSFVMSPCIKPEPAMNFSLSLSLSLSLQNGNIKAISAQYIIN